MNFSQNNLKITKTCLMAFVVMTCPLFSNPKNTILEGKKGRG